MYVSAERTFHLQVAIGQVMSSRGVGQVIASKNSNYVVGEIIQSTLGWQEYCVLAPDSGEDTDQNVKAVQKVPNPVRPLTTIMGVFGSNAYSAHVGLIEIGKIKAGDVAVISSAGGGVGTLACQIARAKGASKVVGIAGGKEKCEWLVEQGLCDAAIDYKNEDVVEALGIHCPDGLDVYLDAVGGDILDAALQNLAVGARIVICGMISTEYMRPRPPGPTHYFNLLYRRSTMEGFFVFDYVDRWPEFDKEIRQWYKDGKLKSQDHVFKGLEEAPTALGSLFTGGHQGGSVIRVSEDPADLAEI
jgi:NADPH-dependent curcumin reductase CurA